MNVSKPQEPNSETKEQAFILPQMHQFMVVSLFQNVKEALFPEKLPPLKLTSRPVNVRQIWSQDHRTTAAGGSLTLHVFAVACLIALSILGARSTAVFVKPVEHVTLIAPPLSDYQPVMKPSPHTKLLMGGGGGGDHAKLLASK